MLFGTGFETVCVWPPHTHLECVKLYLYLYLAVLMMIFLSLAFLDLVWVTVMVVTLIGHSAFILYYVNKILEYQLTKGKLVSNVSKISCPIHLKKKKNCLHCYLNVLCGLC